MTTPEPHKLTLVAGGRTKTLGRDGKVLYNGGEPPGGGGMLDIRVARLEDDMKEVKADLKSLRTDVAELKGRVSLLPGYGGIAIIVGLIVGLSTIAQVLPQLFPPVVP